MWLKLTNIFVENLHIRQITFGCFQQTIHVASTRERLIFSYTVRGRSSRAGVVGPQSLGLRLHVTHHSATNSISLSQMDALIQPSCISACRKEESQGKQSKCCRLSFLLRRCLEVAVQYLHSFSLAECQACGTRYGVLCPDEIQKPVIAKEEWKNGYWAR